MMAGDRSDYYCWNESDLESVIMNIESEIEISAAEDITSSQTMTNPTIYSNPITGTKTRTDTEAFNNQGNCHSIMSSDIAKLNFLSSLAVFPDNLDSSISCCKVDTDDDNNIENEELHGMVPTTKNLSISDIRKSQPPNINPLLNSYHNNNTKNDHVVPTLVMVAPSGEGLSPQHQTKSSVQTCIKFPKITDPVISSNIEASMSSLLRPASKSSKRKVVTKSVKEKDSQQKPPPESKRKKPNSEAVCLVETPKINKMSKMKPVITPNIETSMSSLPQPATKTSKRKVVTKSVKGKDSQQKPPEPKRKKPNSKTVCLMETPKINKMDTTMGSDSTVKVVGDLTEEFLMLVPVSLSSSVRNQYNMSSSSICSTEKSTLAQHTTATVAEELSQPHSPKLTSLASLETETLSTKSDDDDEEVTCLNNMNSRTNDLLEDNVSESDDELEKSSFRKCVVCLQRKLITMDVCEPVDEISDVVCMEPTILKPMIPLLNHLKVPIRGLPSEVGLCLPCFDHLHKFSLFFHTASKLHNDVMKQSLACSTSHQFPTTLESIKSPQFIGGNRLQEVHKGSTHMYLVRRNITDSDWNFLSETLSNRSSTSTVGITAEKYFMGREKLSQIYCVQCKRLVHNGKKGFLKHMTTNHAEEPILLPCEICGAHLPEIGTANRPGYFSHWVGHFSLVGCEEEQSQPFLTEEEDLELPENNNKQHASPEMEETIDVTSVSMESNASRTAQTNETQLEKIDSNINGNYSCNICKEAFKIERLLQIHMQEHGHAGTTELLHKCGQCNKSFKTVTGLNIHVSGVHQRGTGEHICDYCGKCYRKKSYLREHKRIHTNEYKKNTPTPG